MSTRARVLAFIAVVVVIAVAATVYVVDQGREVRAERAAEPEAEQTPITEVTDGPRIVFRHTGLDSQYGVVAVVPLDDPGGPRAFTGVSCNRVAARPEGASCLVSDDGVAASYEGMELDADWQQVASTDLPGIPSRTRRQPRRHARGDDRLRGRPLLHAAGFSTATEIHEFGGGERWGNLEKFQLVVDGREVNPVDRNIWGVTFVDDDTFYATVATGGRRGSSRVTSPTAR